MVEFIIYDHEKIDKHGEHGSPMNPWIFGQKKM